MVFISGPTMDANLRVSQFKLDVLEMAYEKNRHLTTAEYEVALAELVHDATRRRFQTEKKRRDKRNGFEQ